MNHEQNLERFKTLMSQVVDGGMSASESNELQAIVESNPELLEHMADQLILDSLLAEELGTDSMVALVDIVANPQMEVKSNAAMRIAQVRSSSQSTGSLQQSPIRLHKTAFWFVAASVLAIAAFFVGRWDTSAYANAASIVRAALATHSELIERVYVVDVQRDQPGVPGFTPPRDVHVMTQGDRFWVEMNRGDRSWCWGRDADGATWLTLGPRRAIRIDSEEAGTPLQTISDIYSLNLETLLDNVLRHGEVRYSANAGPTHVISVTPSRQSLGWLREMTIEVDKETKTVRRLVIQRSLNQLGKSTVTFTLVDSRVPDESKYRAEGHLTEPFRVLTRDSTPDKRRELLTGWLGSMADRWMKTKE